MALFRQQCRGRGTLAAGSIVLLTLLLAVSAAGAASSRSQAAERYKYAHLLLEDLHSVPVPELGEEQYLLVIEAFQKVARTSPEGSRTEAALLQIANLYREMIGRFGAKVYKPKSIAAYELLVTKYPQSKLADAARGAIAEIRKGTPAPKRPLDPPVDDTEDESVELAEAAPAAGTAATPAAEPTVSAADPAAGAGAAAEVKPAVLKAPDPDAVATLSSRSMVIPVSDKPKTSEPRKTLVQLEGVHFWTNPDYTRVVIQMSDRVELSYDSLDNPKRLFFDLLETRVSDKVLGAPSVEVDGGFLKKVRVAQFGKRSARVVLDLERALYFDVSWLSNPARLVVEVRSTDQPVMLASAPAPVVPPVNPKTASAAETKAPPAKTSAAVTDAAPATPVAGKLETPTRTPDPAASFAHVLDRSAGRSDGTDAAVADKPKPESAALDQSAQSDKAASGEDASKTSASEAKTEAAALKSSEKTAGKDPKTSKTEAAKASAAKTAATRSKQPAQVAAKATDTVAGKVTEKSGDEFASDPEVELANAGAPPVLNLPPPKPASANARGQRNLIRALGLKVGRVVIDAGHGGHDTGSIGGNGLREKDLVLDIALRLGKLIEEGLGSEVIYTRNDDRFISLKERTTLANERKADLFISIHANSSRTRTVRGVETYYLNFTSDSWALTVASRENAASDRPVHELQDLLSKIALKEKIEESREFATRVQNALYDGLGDDSKNIRDRGVRKAPFMVLIGAKMPAVLAEIGFLSNPQTEKMLKTGAYRQKVANHLYQGILSYSDSLGSVNLARSEGSSTIE